MIRLCIQEALRPRSCSIRSTAYQFHVFHPVDLLLTAAVVRHEPDSAACCARQSAPVLSVQLGDVPLGHCRSRVHPAQSHVRTVLRLAPPGKVLLENCSLAAVDHAFNLRKEAPVTNINLCIFGNPSFASCARTTGISSIILTLEFQTKILGLFVKGVSRGKWVSQQEKEVTLGWVTILGYLKYCILDSACFIELLLSDFFRFILLIYTKFFYLYYTKFLEIFFLFLFSRFFSFSSYQNLEPHVGSFPNFVPFLLKTSKSTRKFPEDNSISGRDLHYGWKEDTVLSHLGPLWQVVLVQESLRSLNGVNPFFLGRLFTNPGKDSIGGSGVQYVTILLEKYNI